MEIIIIIAIIIIATFFDALRDGWKEQDVGFWKWHTVKWIAFFLPLIYCVYRLIVLGISFWPMVVVVLVSWILWQFVIHVICGRNWTSVWIKLFKKIFKKET